MKYPKILGFVETSYPKKYSTIMKRCKCVKVQSNWLKINELFRTCQNVQGGPKMQKKEYEGVPKYSKTYAWVGA